MRPRFWVPSETVLSVLFVLGFTLAVVAKPPSLAATDGAPVAQGPIAPGAAVIAVRTLGEVDALVAAKLKVRRRAYSSSMTAAWRLAESEFTAVNVTAEFYPGGEAPTVCQVRLVDKRGSETLSGGNKSVPLAISLAALKSVGVEVRLEPDGK